MGPIRRAANFEGHGCGENIRTPSPSLLRPGAVVDEPPVQLGREPVDLAGQLGVGLELQFLLSEVVIRLLELRLPFWPIMTNVDKKIASSDTISVSVGHGLDSMNSIQTVNSTTCR